MHAEQKKNRAYLAQQRKQLERDIRKRTLAALRKRLAELRTARKVALGTVRTLCKRGKLRARQAAKDLRARELARLREETSAIRRQANSECKERRARVEARVGAQREKLKAHAREEARGQRALGRIDKAHAVKVKASRSALERRQESDDEVTRNVGPELQSVWRAVRKRFAQAPRGKSRSEAFLEWAEENPDEVLALQTERGEALAAKDIADLHAMERDLRKSAKARSGYTVAELQAFQRLGIDPLAPAPTGKEPPPF